MLIEIDLENNPVDCMEQVLATIVSKKDLLVFNLKLAPCVVKTTNINDFYSSCDDVEVAKRSIGHFSNGVLYRSKRVYGRIKQHLQSQAMASKRSIGGFSAESGSG